MDCFNEDFHAKSVINCQFIIKGKHGTQTEKSIANYGYFERLICLHRHRVVAEIVKLKDMWKEAPGRRCLQILKLII